MLVWCLLCKDFIIMILEFLVPSSPDPSNPNFSNPPHTFLLPPSPSLAREFFFKILTKQASDLLQCAFSLLITKFPLSGKFSTMYHCKGLYRHKLSYRKERFILGWYSDLVIQVKLEHKFDFLLPSVYKWMSSDPKYWFQNPLKVA